jgi:hypothetical protein
VSSEARDSLISSVRALEDGTEKDWHPGSGNQVLDLVHPSLFCLVSGRSRIINEEDRPLRLEASLHYSGPTDVIDFKDFMPKPTSNPLFELFSSPEESTSASIEFISEEDDLCRTKAGYVSENYQWLPAEFSVEKDGCR